MAYDAYDEPFWKPRRGRPSYLTRRSAYSQLHDYDFEMRRPYRTGRLVDAYMEWRRFKAEEGLDDPGRPLLDELEVLRRWEEWRRAQRRPGGRRRLRERRRGRVRGPRWTREGL